MLIRLSALAALALAAACSDSAPEAPPPENIAEPTNEVTPPAPDPEPAPAREPSTDEGSEDPAEVLRDYYARIEAGDYAGAWALRIPSRSDGAEGLDTFAASFDRYAVYRATVGAPGRIEGAAGSLYVDVPVQIYGRMKDGTQFSSAGTVTLRRSNDVPGSTEAQRRWRIYARD